MTGSFSCSFLIILFLVLSGCTRSHTSRHQANAEGNAGVVSFDNARLRCSFVKDSSQARTYSVDCQVAVVGKDGNEVKATSIRPGLQLDWLAPFRLSGGDASFSDIVVAPDQLSQRVSVTLASTAPAKVQFDLLLKDLATAAQKKESDILLLPLSAESYGVVPELLSYQLQTSGELAGRGSIAYKGEKIGLQSEALPPNRMGVGIPRFGCAIGDKFYLTANHYVYVLEDGKLRLFAGSPNPANPREGVHRLRLRLGEWPAIACGTDALYVLSYYPTANQGNSLVGKSIVLKITDTTVEKISQISGENEHSFHSLAVGPDESIYAISFLCHIVKVDKSRKVTPFANNTGACVHSTDGPALTSGFGFSFISAAQDGSLILADQSHHQAIRKISPDGKLTTVITGLPEVPKGVVMTPDGVIYYGTSLGIRKSTDAPNTQEATLGGYLAGAARPATVLSYDKTGLIFSEDQTISRLEKDGKIVTLLKTGIVFGVNDPSDETVAEFGAITALTIGSDDSIYVADIARVQVLKIDPAGTTKIYAGNRSPVATNAETGLAREIALRGLDGLAIASDDTLYIGESIYGIRKINPQTGEMSTIPDTQYSTWPAIGNREHLYYLQVGNLHFAGSPIAALNGVGMMRYTVLPDGSVAYLYNSGENIRRAVGKATMTQGKIADLIQPHNPGFAGDGGNSLTARLGSDVADIDSDSRGRIYIADPQNGRIRRLVPNAQGSYNIETFIGGEPRLDCSGEVKKNVNVANLEGEINVSLASLCLSKPATFAIREFCGPEAANPHITMAIGQSFGTRSNVIRIKRPCF